MVSPSRDIGQFCVSAALLALSACGSGEIGPNTTPQPGPSAYAYVASAGASPSSAGAIYEYGIVSDSSVAALAQSSISAGVYPAVVVVGQGHVYAVNVGDGTISQYNVGTGGILTAMNPATVTNPGMHTFGAAPAAATIDPTGSFFYVTNAADNTLSQFSIGSGGQLTPMTPSTVATGVDPTSIAVVLLPDTTPGYYVVNSGAPGDTGTVSLYASGENGALTPVEGDTVAAGTNPSAVAVNSAFSTVYVMSNCNGAQCTGSIRQFALAANGALTDTGAIAASGSHYDAVNMVMNQNGTNAYVLSNAMGADGNGGALWQYGVETTGELTTASPPMLNIGPMAVAQVIQVNSLYVLTTNANTASTGGNINFYSLGTGGAASLTATAEISAPYPITMGVLFLLAP